MMGRTRDLMTCDSCNINAKIMWLWPCSTHHLLNCVAWACNSDDLGENQRLLAAKFRERCDEAGFRVTPGVQTHTCLSYDIGHDRQVSHLVTRLCNDHHCIAGHHGSSGGERATPGGGAGVRRGEEEEKQGQRIKGQAALADHQF